MPKAKSASLVDRPTSASATSSRSSSTPTTPTPPSTPSTPSKPTTPASRPQRKARVAVPATTQRQPAPAKSKSALKPMHKRQLGAAVEGTTSKPLSTLDAAAQILGGLSSKEASQGLSATDLINRMAAAALWTSPGGKTPAATLYAAISREISRKGDDARFIKSGPGRFGTSAGAQKKARASARERFTDPLVIAATPSEPAAVTASPIHNVEQASSKPARSAR